MKSSGIRPTKGGITNTRPAVVPDIKQTKTKIPYGKSSYESRTIKPNKSPK